MAVTLPPSRAARGRRLPAAPGGAPPAPPRSPLSAGRDARCVLRQDRSALTDVGYDSAGQTRQRMACRAGRHPRDRAGRFFVARKNLGTSSPRHPGGARRGEDRGRAQTERYRPLVVRARRARRAAGPAVAAGAGAQAGSACGDGRGHERVREPAAPAPLRRVPERRAGRCGSAGGVALRGGEQFAVHFLAQPARPQHLGLISEAAQPALQLGHVR